jgi:uncharacterized protein YfaP (DUF2135 family)
MAGKYLRCLVLQAVVLQVFLSHVAALRIQVTDSSTGGAVINAVCVVQNARTLKTVGSVLSDQSGTCSFDNAVRDAGHYLVQVSQLGYFNTEARVYISSSTTSSSTSAQVQLSPSGAENRFRIVLSWGDDVADLDAYMIHPSQVSPCRSSAIQY